jgi:hypothetical protein
MSDIQYDYSFYSLEKNLFKLCRELKDLKEARERNEKRQRRLDDLR